MKKILPLLLALLCALCAWAGVSDRYTSRITPDGTLIFVMPQKLGRTENIKRFEYDITMLSWTDSVTINFTFESKLMAIPSSLTLSSGNVTFECDNYSPLFIDLKKNRYEIRITSRFPAHVLDEILGSDTPPVFSFTQEGVTGSATYSPGAWKKERHTLSDIYKLYLYAKPK